MSKHKEHEEPKHQPERTWSNPKAEPKKVMDKPVDEDNNVSSD